MNWWMQRLRDESIAKLSLQLTHAQQEKEQLKDSLAREHADREEMKVEVCLNYC